LVSERFIVLNRGIKTPIEAVSQGIKSTFQVWITCS